MARIERRQRVVFKVGEYGSLDAGAKLTIILEPGKTLIMGREKKYCNIALNDSALSRKHLSLEVKDGGVLAKDLETKNGTDYNGLSLSAEGEYISSGDMIRLGQHLLIVDSVEKILDNTPVESKIIFEQAPNQTGAGQIVSGYGK